MIFSLFLSRFCDALYLVAFAQAGVEPKTSLLTQGGELPLPSLPPLSSWEEGEDGELEFKDQPSRSPDPSYNVRRAVDGSSQVASAIEKLKDLYNSTVMPMEKDYRFDLFHMPLMRDSDFEAKPSIVLLGQYSVGKTTFIRYLLGREYPSAQVSACHAGQTMTNAVQVDFAHELVDFYIYIYISLLLLFIFFFLSSAKEGGFALGCFHTRSALSPPLTASSPSCTA